MQRTFTETIFAELGTIPRRGLLLIVAVNLVSGLHAFSLWGDGRDPTIADGLFFAIEVIFAIGAMSVCTMLLVHARPSPAASLRFVATFVVGLVPILIPAGLLLLAIRADYREGWMITLLLVMLAGIPLSAMLSA